MVLNSYPASPRFRALLPIIAALLPACSSDTARNPENLPRAATGPELEHTLFLIDTSGSAYQYGYLDGTYTNYMTDVLADLDKGSTVTCITYDSEARFSPSSRPINDPKDIQSSVDADLIKCDDYWRGQENKGVKNLEATDRGGTRLDLALKKAVTDLKNSPSNARITVYFLTDGGADFGRSAAQGGAAEASLIKQAESTITASMASLRTKFKVVKVYLCGLKEVTSKSALFHRKTVIDQWRYGWLEGVPTETVDFESKSQ